MSDPQTPQEKMSSLRADVTGTVKDVLNEARPALNRVADRVNDSVHDLLNQGKEAACKAERQLENEARHLRATAEHHIQHAPIKSILIAAGTGAATALAAAWLMRSRNH